MPTYKKSTWREDRYEIQPNDATAIYFRDTKPNHIYVANNGPLPLYMSAASVSPTTFDMIIPPFGQRLFSKEMGVDRFSLYSENKEVVTITVNSWEGEFDPASLPQSQEIVTTGATGLLGTMDIREMLNALPPGNNMIGRVYVENPTDSPNYTSLLNIIVSKLDSLVEAIKDISITPGQGPAPGKTYDGYPIIDNGYGYVLTNQAGQYKLLSFTKPVPTDFKMYVIDTGEEGYNYNLITYQNQYVEYDLRLAKDGQWSSPDEYSGDIDFYADIIMSSYDIYSDEQCTILFKAKEV